MVSGLRRQETILIVGGNNLVRLEMIKEFRVT